MHRFRFLAFVLSFMSIAQSSWGWGGLGHRTTGHLAEAALTPQARQAVRALLGDASLADVANWADSIKKDPHFRHASWYHFDSVEDGSRSYVDHIARLPADIRMRGGLLQAILVSERTLENPSESWGQKNVALKFLVHFVGDLHQPLHSGRPEDKGGLRVPVRWGERDSNLHSVWDSGLILTGRADIFSQLPPNTDWSGAYAHFLYNKFAGRVSLPENTRHNPEAWLNESIYYRTMTYDPRYQTDQKAYQNEYIDMIDWRVYLAGVRIADTLNRIFAGFRAPSVQEDLMRRLELIVGRLHHLITLGPRQPVVNEPEYWSEH